jgi:signal transduction histidine kinase
MIRDEGMGIPAEEQKHIGTRFFRASNVINVSGTGLGLNIVQAYLHLLHGVLDFESIEGNGTTFWIKVPHQYEKQNSDH